MSELNHFGRSRYDRGRKPERPEPFKAGKADVLWRQSVKKKRLTGKPGRTPALPAPLPLPLLPVPRRFRKRRPLPPPLPRPHFRRPF